CLACTKNFFGDLIQNVTPQDPKTELQEALHADGCDIPNYLLEMVEGPEHAPTFISVVEVGGKIFGRGSGSTKKASQQAAALEALKKIRPGDDIDRIFSTPNKVER
ncbi:MAG: putative dsRNA-binding protein, partial [Bdellovibrionota bacterium]